MRFRLVIAAVIGVSGLVGSGSAVASGDTLNRYIVVLNSSVSDPQAAAQDVANSHGLHLGHVYGHALKGFSAAIPEASLAQIARDPRVRFISRDRAFSIEDTPSAPTPGTLTPFSFEAESGAYQGPVKTISSLAAAGGAYAQFFNASPLSPACPKLTKKNGLITETITVTTAGIYYVWSRMVTDSGGSNYADSYYLQIDKNCPSVVGNQANTHLGSWTWINFQRGSTSNVISADLTAGTHTVRMEGRSSTLGLDRLVFTQDSLCTPTDLGDNCLTSQAIPTGVHRIGINTSNRGAGVGVAVLDTGVDLSHPDLAANIVASKSCVSYTTSANDDWGVYGHGTHVAGIVAALDNNIGSVGVAPQAKIIPVKVFDVTTGTASTSDILCGIDWITQNASLYNIKVANMSFGGGGSNDNNCGNTNNDVLHQAICNSTAQGITYVAGAGNNASDVSNFAPADYDDTVITVSALVDTDGFPGGLANGDSNGADDTFASYSNYGSAIDLGAPGDLIYSLTKDGGYYFFTGTSEAAPHVSGAAALYLASHPGATWSEVRDGLEAVAEPLGSGHTDPSGLHPEPVVQAGSL